MKKSLLALAMVGLFASAANAADNYQIYGRVDLGLTKTNTNGDSNMKMDRGTQSRLGFKGTEDLGDGLKANFKIEHRFSADTGAGNAYGSGDPFWRGQAWLGLSGGFGEVRAGRQYRVFADASEMVDPWGGDYLGTSFAYDTYRLSGAHTYTTPVQYFSEGLGTFAPAGRNNNALTYISPEMNGFKVQLQYAFSESNYAKTGSNAGYNDSKVANTVGGSLSYQTKLNGGDTLSLGFAAQRSGDTDYAKQQADATLGKETEALLYANYDFGKGTVGLGYYSGKTQDYRNDGSVSTAFNDDLKAQGYTISGTYKVTNKGTILAGYQSGKFKENYKDGYGYNLYNSNGTTSFYGATDMKYSKFALGYQHALSDRTTVYINYGKEKVKNIGFANDLNNDGGTVYGFGIKHNF